MNFQRMRRVEGRPVMSARIAMVASRVISMMMKVGFTPSRLGKSWD